MDLAGPHKTPEENSTALRAAEHPLLRRAGARPGQEMTDEQGRTHTDRQGFIRREVQSDRPQLRQPGGQLHVAADEVGFVIRVPCENFYTTPLYMVNKSGSKT
jgi:hypothetical protein